MHDAHDLRDLLPYELAQRRSAGFAIESVTGDAERALQAATGPNDPSLLALLERLEGSSRVADWPFVEVDDARDFISMLDGHRLSRPVPSSEELHDRVLGAWLGRCAGCLLGKPVEGWTADQIRRYLDGACAWPLSGYIPRAAPYPADAPPMTPSWVEATHGAIDGMARDDDLDYTVLGLLLLERTAGDPTADDVAAQWLARLPAGQTYTAERAAYRNLLLGFGPPLSATHRNPYREWIGALIRVDAYAYTSPGDPVRAAELAARDASVSHVGSGIAAAMWAAAVISLALVGVPSSESVPSALELVPDGTRLHAALRQVVDLHRGGSEWEESLRRIMAANAQYNWVHAIPNAALIAASLLWGGGDFERSVTYVVSAGHDTDSNGATVGSAAGALLGSTRLPVSWIEPLHDTLRTSVAGLGAVRISELAERTVQIANRHRSLATAAQPET
ncbi:MAG: ADP-ribosylglycohydrolase family protein [Candidatus Limnocylindria bacterium]